MHLNFSKCSFQPTPISDNQSSQLGAKEYFGFGKDRSLILVIGGSLGAIYQYGLKDPQYESSMTVEPNYGSSVQLYKNIEYYLNLIKQDDFERLASSLGITEQEAETISWIEAEPYSNENEVILAYKNYIG